MTPWQPVMLLLALILAAQPPVSAQADPVSVACKNKPAGKYADITSKTPFCTTTYIECDGAGNGRVVEGNFGNFDDGAGGLVPAVWNDFAKEASMPGALGTFNCNCTALFSRSNDSATACTVCMALQATGVCDPANLNIKPDYACLGPFPVNPLDNVYCGPGGFQLTPIPITSTPPPSPSPSPSPSPAPLNGTNATDASPPPKPQKPKPAPRRGQCSDLGTCCANQPLAAVLVPAFNDTDSNPRCSRSLVQCRAEGGVLLDLDADQKSAVPYVLQPLDVSGTYAVLPGAVGTKGCNCTQAYEGVRIEVQEMYTLSCQFCMNQTAEIRDPVPLPGMDGTCTACLYSGPVPAECNATEP